MKKALATLFPAILLISSAIVSAEELPSGVSAVSKPSSTFKGKGYSITFPNHWAVEPGYMGLDVIAQAPPLNKLSNSQANISVISAPLPPGTTIDYYLEKNLENLKTGLQDFNLIETGKAIVGGVSGKRIIYNHSVKEMKLYVMQYFIITNDNGYVITCTAIAEDYQHYLNSFERSVQTFKFL